jgi:hypothetical protein
MNNLVDFITRIRDYLTDYIDNFSQASADTFAWISIVVLNLCTIPTYLAVMAGVTDKMPPLDMTLLLWVGLLLYFVRSAIIKDMLMVFTIGVGFAIQSILLGLIYFV